MMHGHTNVNSRFSCPCLLKNPSDLYTLLTMSIN